MNAKIPPPQEKISAMKSTGALMLNFWDGNAKCMMVFFWKKSKHTYVEMISSGLRRELPALFYHSVPPVLGALLVDFHLAKLQERAVSWWGGVGS
jgi:hypothetical protein